MATKKKRRRLKKTYRFQLTLGGIAGIAVVCFCLFVWLFLLGIWAGQTILLPAAPSVSEEKASSRSEIQTLVPSSKKKQVK